jgi:hypothetical protein
VSVGELCEWNSKKTVHSIRMSVILLNAIAPWN